MRVSWCRRHAAIHVGVLLVVGLVVGCDGSPGVTSVDPPAFGAAGDQRTPMGDVIEVPFSVVDEVPSSVVVVASSDDQTLVADGDLEVLGSGIDRTLRVTPSALGTGSVVITLRATNEAGLEGVGSFRLDVTRPFQAQLPKLTASDAANSELLRRLCGCEWSLRDHRLPW